MRGVLTNGSEIVTVRTERGLTQDQLAAKARLDVKTIRKAEQGNRIDVSTLTRLAMALDVDVSRLIVSASILPEDQVPRRDVLLQWHRAWHSEDIEALVAIYHPEAVITLPGGPNISFSGKHQGHAAIRRLHEFIWKNVEDEPVPFEDLEIQVNGDVVTLTGQKNYRSPTGQPYALRCAQIFRFDGNHIASQEVYYDTLEWSNHMPLEEPFCATTNA